MTTEALVQAVVRADATAVHSLVAQAGPLRWPAIVGGTADERSQRTVLHHALAAQFELLNDPRANATSVKRSLKRHHSVLKLLLRAGPGVATRWCPLVDAVHYRLHTAIRRLIETLASAPSTSQLRECLTERDAYGQTVLHAAAAAKASGVARRLLLGGGDAALRLVGEEIGVRLPLPPARRGGRGPLSVVPLNEAIGHADLELLLEAGGTAGLGAAWLDATDGRGRTAMHHAARAGRAGAILALRAANASTRAVEAGWGGSCGHLAASRGHTAALHAWATGQPPAADVASVPVDAHGQSGVLGGADATPVSDAPGLEEPRPEGQAASALMAMVDGRGRAIGAVWWPREASSSPSASGPGPSSLAGEEARPAPAPALRGWQPAPHADELGGLADAAADFAHPPALGSVEVVDARELNASEFGARFEAAGVPVLLRNAMHNWGAMRADGPGGWSRERLVSAAGKLSVRVSSLPYQQRDGDAQAKTVRLSKFLKAMLARPGRQERSAGEGPPTPRSEGRIPTSHIAPPSYVFDSGRLLGATDLGPDCPDPEVFRLEEGGAVLRQLSISPALAGAHPHFHGAAYNALVVGRRRWALVPPDAAEFTTEPALRYFERLRHGEAPASTPTSAPATDGGADDAGPDTPAPDAVPPWLDVLQEAGEVLYVPPQWGHATLSLQESVAVAVEFQ